MSNYPSDWGSYYSTCYVCGGENHASGTCECECRENYMREMLEERDYILRTEGPEAAAEWEADAPAFDEWQDQQEPRETYYDGP